MENLYNDFIKKVIEPRKQTINERQQIMMWNIDSKLPPYLTVKIEEIRLAIILGLDNFSIKNILILMEEILRHILISNQITTKEDYIVLLKENDRKFKYGHQVLDELKNKIDKECYDICIRYFNDERNGGERIRNIEIHNLLHEKIDRFDFDSQLLNQIGEEDSRMIINMIKNDPNLAHFGTMNLNSRTIIQDFYNLFILANRNSVALSKFNNIQDKHSYEIEKNLTKSKFFFIEVEQSVDQEHYIEDDIKKLGDVLNIIKVEFKDTINNQNAYKYKFETRNEHTSLDMLLAFDHIKSSNYSIKSIGIDIK